mmetsp:Transcript_558/g.1981  ORF Transcript_558/g.1981 Transcript_558/m.1981 type:complete len:82 (+) Transcript_558:888-1133(+)
MCLGKWMLAEWNAQKCKTHPIDRGTVLWAGGMTCSYGLLIRGAQLGRRLCQGPCMDKEGITLACLEMSIGYAVLWPAVKIS